MTEPTRPQSQTPVAPDLYTKEYFLTACEGYDEFIASEGDRLSRRLNAGFALASVQPGMRVLDVGCGRGEILRHCARLGADAYGIDYAPVAVRLSRDVITGVVADTDDGKAVRSGSTGVAQSDAKRLPFAANAFDRVLMFDVVEHLYPWELHQTLLEIRRVLKPDGRFIVHTAPNAWYDRYAYPVVRRFRTLAGQGDKYPANPRAFLVDVNQDVHVNEQSILSMRRTLRRAGFSGRVWLDSPPQPPHRDGLVLDGLRRAVFAWPPFRWFFQREVFAVAAKL
ncbi:MAG: class I SAM-dependent methyltransferase [Aggregatilineales bacterium]